VAPDDHRDEYDFSRLGPRVPALLVSPWVDAALCPTRFDHTSALRYLCDKYDLQPLGARAAAAASFAPCIRKSGLPRQDTPERLQATAASGREFRLARAAEPKELTDHQRAIVAFADWLGAGASTRRAVLGVTERGRTARKACEEAKAAVEGFLLGERRRR
jgi:phospholipase C